MARTHAQRDISTMFAYSKELFQDWDTERWGVKTYNFKKKSYDILASGLSRKDALAFAQKRKRLI